MPIIDMVMPKMGESVQEGTVISWKVAAGDSVEKDQILLDIATDKVDTEVPSPAAGTLTEVLVGPDETVEVGTVIARINTDQTSSGSSGSSAPASAPAVQATPAPTPAPAPARALAPASAKPAPAPAATPAPALAESPDTNSVAMVMPKMGESVQEGTVISWKVAVGDQVEKDQILLDIATDKVDTEVPSPASGTILEILVGPDQTVEVGAVIARIGAASATGATGATGAAGVIAAGPSNDGSAAGNGNGVSIPGSAHASANSTSMPAVSESQVAPASAVATLPAPAAESTEIPRRDGERFYSPLVRKIASAQGVSVAELRTIKGSGINGRVSKADLLAWLPTRTSAPAAVPAPTVAVPAPTTTTAAPAGKPAPAEKKTLEQLGFDPSRVRVEKMNFMRRKIAQHMRESLDTSAHVYQVHEVDMTHVVELRNSVKDAFKAEFGFSLTFTSFIIWAATRALRQYPVVGCRINGDEIIIPDYVNFGMAVALPDNGLVVPKIKNCEDLTITGIQRRINDLATRAREGKLSPDDMTGGTFTLTNMGSYGSIFGLPIISQPEVAILGCGVTQQRAVIKDGGIAVRWMMYNALSFDHRIVDGKLAADFLNAVSFALENIDPAMVGFDRRKG